MAPFCPSSHTTHPLCIGSGEVPRTNYGCLSNQQRSGRAREVRASLYEVPHGLPSPYILPCLCSLRCHLGIALLCLLVHLLYPPYRSILSLLFSVVSVDYGGTEATPSTPCRASKCPRRCCCVHKLAVEADKACVRSSGPPPSVSTSSFCTSQARQMQVSLRS